MFRIKTKNGCLEISKEIVVVLIMDVFSAAYFLSAKGLSKQSMMFPIFLLCGIQHHVHQAVDPLYKRADCYGF